MIRNNSFEAAYPRYDFAPLVRIGVAIAAMISGSRLAKDKDRKSNSVDGGAFGSAA